MRREEITTLAQAGMEIGFHTLHHPTLVAQPEEELDSILTEGRAQLAEAAGQPVRFFAYPYGKADRAVARCAEAAGYRAAFTNLGYAVHHKSHPFLLGRWDTRIRDADEFIGSIALRLSRPFGGPRR